MSCLKDIVLVNVVFEFKFLNDFMGRQGPIEFDIFLSYYILFVH